MKTKSVFLRILTHYKLRQRKKKKKKKTGAEKGLVRLSHKWTGHVRKFIPEQKKEFKWLKDISNGMTCKIC